MILAFDTSLHEVSIGLFDTDARELASFHYSPSSSERGAHDSMLAAKTAELLARISAKPQDVERIAIVAGPGSFTGLRIGYAFAKGLAYAIPGVAVTPIPSHQALRQTLRARQDDSGVVYIYPGYDRHSLYAAEARSIEEVALVAIADFHYLADTIFAGPPSALEILPSGFGNRIVCAIDLASVVRYSERLPQLTNLESLAQLEPLYITPFVPHPASRANN